MNKAKKKKQLNKYAQFSGIAFQMIAIICLGTFIGVKLDQKIPNKQSLFTVFSSLFSVLIAIYITIKQISNFNKKEESEHEK